MWTYTHSVLLNLFDSRFMNLFVHIEDLNSREEKLIACPVYLDKEHVFYSAIC